MNTTKRSYTMGSRADGVAATRDKILRATVELASRRPLAAVSLDDVAGLAGVSTQTVLRQFGSRSGLIEAATADALARVTEERLAPAGDVPAAIAILMDHYEMRGRSTLLLLGQEDHDAQARVITSAGRDVHRRWVTDVFAPFTIDDATTDLLVVATDVYAWKLLRVDRGLAREETERRLVALVDAILASRP